MKKHAAAILIVVLVVSVHSCRKADGTVDAEAINEWYSGGSQTVFVSGSGAFNQPFFGLTAAQDRQHELGDQHFEATFNSDPTQLNHGLGPIFNNQSCVSCHIADGRGKAPEAGEALSSLLLRISIPGEGPYGSPLAAPGFGGQLQQRGIFGIAGEADVHVTYTESTFYFPDGEEYRLRIPHYELNNAYTTLPTNLLVSARMASPVFGLGLLESIPTEDLMAYADPLDANTDGISGRPNMVHDAMQNSMRMGRFGWKAGQPSIIQQTAGAYNEDMGITSFIFPQESSLGQPQFDDTYNEPEVADSILFAVAFYVKSLAVPGRRNANEPTVLRGKELFMEAGCAKCHIPSHRTGTDVSFPAISNQLIFPYTDLLLHDMGNGLADNRPDHVADGYEWRTPPLWGIGLTSVVNGHNNFLHDGRARNFIEAIMWHGGEAEQSASFFYQLPAADRRALLSFLNSL